MTNAGEYVFLLEKGRDYSFGTRSFLPDVTYAAVDDIGAAVFEGVLSDVASGVDVSYEWRTSHDNIEIVAPNEQKTEVSPKAGTDSGVYDLSVTATFGQHKLTSTISGYYYTNATEEASLSISAPNVLLLEFNAVQGQAEGTVKIDLQLPEDESGSLSLECVSGADKIQLSGETTWQVECSTTKEVRIVAQSPSVERRDIKLLARFESSKGNSLEECAMLTVIKVWYQAEVNIPENYTRKRFAVGEIVTFSFQPSDVRLNISCDNGTQILDENGGYRLLFPDKATDTTVMIEIEDFSAECLFDIVEPQLVRASPLQESFSSRAGKAGGFGVVFAVWVFPIDVSFRHLEIKEVGQVATDAVGYFAQSQYLNYLDHGKYGADHWVPLNDYNSFNDTVSVPYFDPPWLGGGSFTWPIPCAWRFRFRDESSETIFTQYTQRFELDANGTSRIKKFGYCAERTTNNLHRVIGDPL